MPACSDCEDEDVETPASCSACGAQLCRDCAALDAGGDAILCVVCAGGAGLGAEPGRDAA